MPLTQEASAKLTGLLLLKCRSTTSLCRARQLHALLLTSQPTDQPLSPFTFNHVLSMYAKCGSLFHARKVFDEMPNRNIVSYNSLISAYSRLPDLAPSGFAVLAQMRRESYFPNAGTFTALLLAASAMHELFVGVALHAQSFKSGFLGDAYVMTSLLGMYSNCGDFDSAVKMFECALVKDPVAWNCIISGCLKNDRVEEGLCLYRRMVACGVIPTEFTYSMVLKACGKLGRYACGRLVHARIILGNTLVDLPLENSLIDMYSSCGDIRSASNVFSRIEYPDLVSWNSMILACSETGDGEKAMRLFAHMFGMDNVKPDEYSFAAVISAVGESPVSSCGEPLHALVILCGCKTSVFVGTALVSMYCANGRTESALRVFSLIVKRDVVLWTELISGYCRAGDGESALKFFHSMRQEGYKVDCFVVSTALNACADLASLTQGQMIHCLCIKTGCDAEMSVCGSLIDMYSKNGSLNIAQSIFYGIAEPDLKCWNSMIGSFGHHGKANEALKLLDEIQSHRLKPDEVTFISLLSVCGHSGLVEQGRLLWRYMQETGLTPGPKHYSCMVSLLSRVGLFEEAKEMIYESPFRENHPELWRTVLSSSVAKKDLEVGLHAAKKVVELDAEDSATHILLSNLYAAVGRWDCVMEVRKRIRGLMMEKDPGLSWIQLMKDFVVFSSGDISHPQTDQVQGELHRLHANMGIRPNVEEM